MAGYGGSTIRTGRNPFAAGAGNVEFTVGAEATNVIKVTARVRAANGRTLQKRQNVRAYLTQNTTTLAVAGAAPSGTVVVAAKGVIVVSPTAKLVHDVTLDANGEFDLNITEAGAATWYLVVVVGDQCFVSDAITFA